MWPDRSRPAGAEAAEEGDTGRFDAVEAGGRGRAWRPRPWLVLAALIVLQWGCVIVYARTIPHNGWLYFSGGDQTWYYTTSWVLGTGHIPQAVIGYGYSMVLAPIAKLAGPYLPNALPAIIVFNVAVLLPLALLAVYGIAARIVGRATALAVTALWVVVPYLAIPLFAATFRQDYTDFFLPQTQGLTALGDFPSMVTVLGAVFFAMRALDGRRVADAAASGILAGFAIGVKPANALLLPLPPIALALARKFEWRLVTAYCFALAPAILTLAIWKKRGIGVLPILGLPSTRLAAGPAAGGTSDTNEGVGRYIHLDLHHLHLNLVQFHQIFWSVRIVEWLVLAGIVAAARRKPSYAVLMGGWLAAYVVLKGSASVATVFSTSFFRLVMPAFPAAFLLAASIPLLVPRLGDRLLRAGAAAARPRYSRIAATAVGIVFAAIPLAVVVIARPLEDASAVTYGIPNLYVTSPTSFPSAVIVSNDPQRSVRLHWSPPGGRFARKTHVFYQVFRQHGDNGVPCAAAPHVTLACTLIMDYRARTDANALVDSPGSGTWFYRVGVAANWRAKRRFGGDLMMLSRPARAEIP